MRVVGNDHDNSNDSFEFGYCGKCARLVHSGKGQCFHCGGHVAFPEEQLLADLVRNITAISQSVFCAGCGTITAPRKMTEQRKAGLLTSRTETVESTVCSHCGREYEYKETSGTTFIGTGNDDADFAVDIAVSPIFDWDKPTKTWTGQLVSMRAMRDATCQRIKTDAPDKAKAILEELVFWEIKFTLKETTPKEKSLRESHVFWKLVYEGNMWGAAQATRFSNSVNPGMIQNSLHLKGYGDRNIHLRFMSESFQALGVLERVNNYISQKLGTNDLSEIVYGNEFFNDAQTRQRFLDMVGVRYEHGFVPVPRNVPPPTQAGGPTPPVTNEQGGGRKPRTWDYLLSDYIEVGDVSRNMPSIPDEWIKLAMELRKISKAGGESLPPNTWRDAAVRLGFMAEARQIIFVDHRTKRVWYWYGAKCADMVSRKMLFLAARQSEIHHAQRNEGSVPYLLQKSMPWRADSMGYYTRMTIQGEEPEEFWTVLNPRASLPECDACSEALLLDKKAKKWQCPKCSREDRYHFPITPWRQYTDHQHILNPVQTINIPNDPQQRTVFQCAICHEQFAR